MSARSSLRPDDDDVLRDGMVDDLARVDATDGELLGLRRTNGDADRAGEIVRGLTEWSGGSSSPS